MSSATATTPVTPAKTQEETEKTSSKYDTALKLFIFLIF